MKNWCNHLVSYWQEILKMGYMPCCHTCPFCAWCRKSNNPCPLSFVTPLDSQGLSCACRGGVFPWPWWPVLWCWVVSCWCPGWHTSVATGRYSKLSSFAPSCWCCPTSGKEKTWASAALWHESIFFVTNYFSYYSSLAWIFAALLLLHCCQHICKT